MHDGTTSAELIKDLEEQLRSGEVQRRKLHNLVQELRGNVRVFARVRPFLPSDGVDLSPEQGPDSSITVRQDGQGLRIAKPGADETAFAFDRTFGPSASQETIFQEVSEFVQSALDGYNVCLFSYGQTGSGKDIMSPRMLSSVIV
jgi:kinesin family protein C1